MYQQRAPGASADPQAERNGHLRDYIKPFTDLEQLGNGWWQGRCPLPGCTDEETSLTVYPNNSGEVFSCAVCGESGNLQDFEQLMMGHRRDPGPLGGRVLLAKGIEEGIEPPEELEPDVLLKGRVHSVYAASGTGKTWLMLWLIKQAIERGENVIVFDQENGPRIISERLAALGVPTENLDEQLHYYSYPSLRLDEEATTAYQTLLDEVEPGLVVFDSWINFLASAGLEENSSNDVASWAVHYTHPARKRGAAVLLLDHVPHENSHARGSTRKKDEVDVMWALKNPMPFDRDTVGRITLHREKDREGWLPQSVGFSVGGTAGGFIFRRSEGTVEEPDPSDGLTASERKVLDTLREDFGEKGARASEWRKAAGQRSVSEPTFYRALRTIKARELVIVRGLRYFPIPDPPDGDRDDSGDSEESRVDKSDSDNYHELSNHYHDSGDSGGGKPLSSLSHPFRGDSDDSSADSQPTPAEVRQLFDNPEFYGGVAKARDHFLEDESVERFERLCRAVCAALSVDASRWSEYSTPVARAMVLGEKTEW